MSLRTALLESVGGWSLTPEERAQIEAADRIGGVVRKGAPEQEDFFLTNDSTGGWHFVRHTLPAGTTDEQAAFANEQEQLKRHAGHSWTTFRKESRKGQIRWIAGLWRIEPVESAEVLRECTTRLRCRRGTDLCATATSI